ncbi:uncharacterized protein LOC120354994 [Nilaparvata lugens]|uniref:uncharacterized protein LOC120354994 n=1 Tax=Nilaparvata lugens TaxID=108931 RepID=UPI00193E094A|nr:uncharacterized protein LOC120354994 [Nilaparvata lugens]
MNCTSSNNSPAPISKNNVDFLHKLGGGNVEMPLVRLTTNEVATNSCREGVEGKRSLNSLLIKKVMEKVVAMSLEISRASCLKPGFKSGSGRLGPECNLLKTSKIN